MSTDILVVTVKCHQMSCRVLLLLSLLELSLVIMAIKPMTKVRCTHAWIAYGASKCSTRLWFLPERDYVTFGSLISLIRLSVVCNVRVPYSGVETIGSNYFLPLCTLPSSDLRAKFYVDSPRGTPASGR